MNRIRALTTRIEAHPVISTSVFAIAAGTAGLLISPFERQDVLTPFLFLARWLYSTSQVPTWLLFGATPLAMVGAGLVLSPLIARLTPRMGSADQPQEFDTSVLEGYLADEIEGVLWPWTWNRTAITVVGLKPFCVGNTDMDYPLSLGADQTSEWLHCAGCDCVVTPDGSVTGLRVAAKDQIERTGRSLVSGGPLARHSRG